MGKPSKEDANGYDIVIWTDSDGDIIATPYTRDGELFILGIYPDWKVTNQMVILSSPKRFFKNVPKGLLVGLQTPNKIRSANTNTLH